jgi:hypothetical protein
VRFLQIDAQSQVPEVGSVNQPSPDIEDAMTKTQSDRYPGLRALVNDRRAIPLDVRLAALGVTLEAHTADDPVIVRLRAPIYVPGTRGDRHVG